MQMLFTKFEKIKMDEKDTLQEFFTNLMDITNSMASLGEKMEESKIVRKVLRSLPKRFELKVTAIEESKDLNKMPLDELQGNLQTYELKFFNRKKSFSFKSMQEESLDEEPEEHGILSFMALVNPTTQSPKLLEHDDLDMSENEEEENVEDTCLELYQECERLAVKVNEMNIIIKDLKKENEATNQRYKEIQEENLSLIEKLSQSSQVLSRFTEGSKKLEKMLGLGQLAHDKRGIGFEGNITSTSSSERLLRAAGIFAGSVLLMRNFGDLMAV